MTSRKRRLEEELRRPRLSEDQAGELREVWSGGAFGDMERVVAAMIDRERLAAAEEAIRVHAQTILEGLQEEIRGSMDRARAAAAVATRAETLAEVRRRMEQAVSAAEGGGSLLVGEIKRVLHGLDGRGGRS